MARTNSTDVAEILDTSLDTGSGGALEAWVEIAHEVVDDIAAVDSSISATRLEQIEKLVAAHLASAQDQRAERISSESRSVSYQGDTGMHFEATKYGQNAMALDPTGTLADQGKPKPSLSVPDAKGIDD